MAHAPSPTTVIDGIECFAAPANSGVPRNRWIVFTPPRTVDGRTFRTEVCGAAEFAVAVKKSARGDLIIDRDVHTWTKTPARKTPFAGV